MCGVVVEYMWFGGMSVWFGLVEVDVGFDGNGLVCGEKCVVGLFVYSFDDFVVVLVMVFGL